MDLVECLPRPLPLCPGALCAEALLLGVDALEHVVPKLDEESAVVGPVHRGLCVVAVVLEGGVDVPGAKEWDQNCRKNGGNSVILLVVGGERRVLVPRVEVDAVEVEEEPVHEEEAIDVDGHQHRDEQERGGAEELVHPLVGDDGEGGRVVEDVVVLVLGPEGQADVAEAVVGELEEVGPGQGHQHGGGVVPTGVAAPAAEGL